MTFLGKLLQHVTRGPLKLLLVAVVMLVGIEATVQGISQAPCPQRGSGALPPAGLLVGLGQAKAVPAFARKFNVTCTTCHIAFPYLNPFGRKFKQAGYRIPDDDGSIDPDMQNHRTISKNLVLDETFPLALGVSGRAFNVQTGSTAMVMPVGKISLIGAGNFGEQGSYYVILNAAPENGEMALSGHGVVGLHPSNYFNVVAGHGNIFHHDPYNSLAGHSLTAEHAHANASEFIQVYGYNEDIYYSAGLASGARGKLGRDRMGFGRFAYNFTPGIALGVFGKYGTTKSPSEDALERNHVESELQFNLPRFTVTRAGADLNAFVGNINVVGRANYLEKAEAGAEAEKLVEGMIEAIYVVTVDDRPLLMPLLRADYIRNLDEGDQLLKMTANISAYIYANARLGIEYAGDFILPQDWRREHRLTVFGSAFW